MRQPSKYNFGIPMFHRRSNFHSGHTKIPACQRTRSAGRQNVLKILNFGLSRIKFPYQYNLRDTEVSLVKLLHSVSFCILNFDIWIYILNPLKPKNAIDISAAIINVIGTSLRGLGTSIRSSLSRIPDIRNMASI